MNLPKRIRPEHGDSLGHDIAGKLFIKLRRPGRHSLLDVIYSGKKLIFDLNETQGFFTDLLRLSGDQSNRIADTADFIIQNGDMGRHSAHPTGRGVMVSKNRCHAGQTLSRRRVDPPDERMRVGASENFTPEHTGKKKIIDKLYSPSNNIIGVFPGG
jgi:hypothetical protein